MVAKNVSLQSTTDGRHQTDPLFCTTVGWEGGEIKVLFGGSEKTQSYIEN